MSRKALILAVLLSTVAWGVLATAMFAPLTASAAGCTSGTLIKGSLAAVYYCGADGKRYVFPNEKTYFTWYSDFSGVTTISDADLATVQIGGNVTYRPGVKMIKIQSDPKVYAVSKNGSLRWVMTEAVATDLYGSNWNQQIDDVSDAFFTNYSIGADISAAGQYDKNAEMSASQSINQDKGLSGDGGVSGSVSVSKAADSPAGATLPLGAMGVNFLKFNVSNMSGSAVTVDSATLRRVGPGAPGDISAVYLYEGNNRLTTGRSVNSSTNEVNFTGLGLSLASGQSRSLWVAVDIASGASAGNVHAMELVNAKMGSTMLSGSPFMGSNFTLAGTSVGSLTITKAGSVTDPQAGEMEAKIAEFTISAGSSEDVRLKRLTVFQGGNLSGTHLTNLKLKQAGLTLATASLDSKLRATFVLAEPGMMLEKGASRTFQVYADIGGGARAGDTLKIFVEEDADLYGVGQTFGHGVTVTRTGYDGDSCTSSAGDCSYSEVEAGQVTINFLGPSSKDIAVDADNAEVFRFNMTAQSNVEVRRLRLLIEGDDLMTGGNPNFTDIKVTNVATNSVWWGPKDVSEDDGDEDLVYNDVQTLMAGQTYTFSVTLDVETGAEDGDEVMISLSPFQSSDLRNLDNNTFLNPSTDVVPNSTLAGNTMTVRESGLDVSLASTPTSQTYIKGTANANMVGIRLEASDAGPVTLTSLMATGWIDGSQGSNGTDQVRDVAQTCRLMDGTTQVGPARSPSSSTGAGNGGLLNFTGLNLAIASGATKTLHIRCDLSNSVSGVDLAFSVEDASTDLTAQDSQGNNVAVSGDANTFLDVEHSINASGSIIANDVALEDSESEAGIVVGGQSGVVLGKFLFTAEDEELKITKLRVATDSGSGEGISSLSLYDGATLVGGPVSPTAGGVANFSAVNFVIPKDGQKTLTVKANLTSVGGSGGAQSGRNLQIFLDQDDNFEARGTSSSTVLTSYDSNVGDIYGFEKLLRRTKPTVSLAALPTSVLTNGTQVISRFTVTADAAGPVSLKKVSFEANFSHGAGTDVELSSFAIRQVGQGTNIATGNASYDNGDCTGGFSSCEIYMIFDQEQTIAAGTSRTYELRATVSGADETGESISVRVLGDEGAGEDTDSLSADGDEIDGSFYYFIWSDRSVTAHNDQNGGSPDWTNGYLVLVLSSDTQTMSRN